MRATLSLPPEPGVSGPVLVVGGGIVGLSAALFLARRDVPCVLVEQRHGVAPYPRFRGLNPRTMELYRAADRRLETDLRALGETRQETGYLGRGPSLGSPRTRWTPFAGDAFPAGVSPCEMCLCDQDRVEPLIRRYAHKLGADLRFATRLVGVDDDGGCARARLADLAGGTESTVAASYVIAADGASSPLRRRLGITSHGPGHAAHRMAIYFRADLSAATSGRPVMACFVEPLGGHLVRRDADRGLWQLSAPFDPASGGTVADFTEERCHALIRLAVGVDVDVDIAEVLPWEIAFRVADRYRSGRVFLAGDAAHVNGPWGGLGANTGIADAHNLAWKLAAAISGTATDRLLDTYDQERRPMGDLVVGTAWRAMQDGRDPRPGGAAKVDLAGAAMGYCYPTAVDDGDSPPTEALHPALPRPAAVESPAHPTGRPGTRAPHVLLDRAGAAVSTIDLVGDGFVLLAGHEAHWAETAARRARQSGLDFTLHRIGSHCHYSDPGGVWAATFGVGPGGASLVRPDGVIAWRAPAADGDPAASFAAALSRFRA